MLGLSVGLMSRSSPLVCSCLWLSREVLLLAMLGDPSEFNVNSQLCLPALRLSHLSGEQAAIYSALP